MKNILCLLLLILLGSIAAAQSTTDHALRYGLKAGVNLSKYRLTDGGNSENETKNTTNFHLTGYLEAPLGSVFAIQSGLSLQGKGAESTIANNTQKQNVMWLEVPVNLLVKLPATPTSHLFIGAGPYAAFGIRGKSKITQNSTESEADVKFGNDVTDNLKGTDFGVNLLGGIQMNSGLNLGINYSFGLANITPEDADPIVANIYNRVVSFSVGFSF